MATTFQYKVSSLKTNPSDDGYITEATVQIFGTEGSVTKSTYCHCVFPGNKSSVGSDFKSLDGISLLPLIRGELFEEKIAYTETANPLHEKSPPKEPNTKSVRTSKWKLISNDYNNSMELYNLEKDPHELENLIGKSFSIETKLKQELNELQKR